MAPQLGQLVLCTLLSQMNHGVLPILHWLHNPSVSEGFPHFGQNLP
jgi:hypothetical protein